jgi:hypothetical protein
MRPRPKGPVSSLTSKLKLTIVKPIHPSEADDTIIEISSGDDTPPESMRPDPMLIAKKKTQNYVERTKHLGKVRTKSALATSDMNSQPTCDVDIIDLT